MSIDGEAVIAAETGKGKYQVEARVGDAAFLVDEPVLSGGLGSGPNPYDLLSAALAACATITIRLYAAHKEWPLAHVEVTVRHTRASQPARDVFALEIALAGDLSDQQLARLIEIADHCPVHQTLARGSEVKAALLPFAAVIPPAANCTGMSPA
jgi:putative redox protein